MWGDRERAGPAVLGVHGGGGPGLGRLWAETARDGHTAPRSPHHWFPPPQGRQLESVKAEAAEKGDVGLVAENSRSTQRLMLPPPALTAAGVFTKFRDIARLAGSAVSGRGGSAGEGASGHTLSVVGCFGPAWGGSPPAIPAWLCCYCKHLLSRVTEAGWSWPCLLHPRTAGSGSGVTASV